MRAAPTAKRNATGTGTRDSSFWRRDGHGAVLVVLLCQKGARECGEWL